MRIHELDLPANRHTRRKGRGISAGQGKTAGRGTKGQNSRTGGGVRPGFEGGQNPLSSRLPKLAGFTSRRTQKQTITTGQLAKVKAKTIDNTALAEAGVIQRLDMPAKVVLKGKLDSAKTVMLQAASPAAAEAIAKAGGKFIETAAPKAFRAGKDKPTKKS